MSTELIATTIGAVMAALTACFSYLKVNRERRERERGEVTTNGATVRLAGVVDTFQTRIDELERELAVSNTARAGCEERQTKMEARLKLLEGPHIEEGD